MVAGLVSFIHRLAGIYHYRLRQLLQAEVSCYETRCLIAAANAGWRIQLRFAVHGFWLRVAELESLGDFERVNHDPE
jgi:hypothetical protein